jgi:hypothetical protein
MYKTRDPQLPKLAWLPARVAVGICKTSPFLFDGAPSLLVTSQTNKQTNKQTNFVAFSPQANYTD